MPGYARDTDLYFYSLDENGQLKLSRNMYIESTADAEVASFVVGNFALDKFSSANFDILNHFLSLDRATIVRTTFAQAILSSNVNFAKLNSKQGHKAIAKMLRDYRVTDEGLKKVGMESVQRLAQALTSNTQIEDNVLEYVVTQMKSKDIEIPLALHFDLKLHGQENKLDLFVGKTTTTGEQEIASAVDILLGFNPTGGNFFIEHGTENRPNWWPYFSYLDATPTVNEKDPGHQDALAQLVKRTGQKPTFQENPQPNTRRESREVEVARADDPWAAFYQTVGGTTIDPLRIHFQLPTSTNFSITEHATSFGIAGYFGRWSRGSEIAFSEDGKKMTIAAGSGFVPYFAKVNFLNTPDKDLVFRVMQPDATYIFGGNNRVVPADIVKFEQGRPVIIDGDVVTRKLELNETLTALERGRSIPFYLPQVLLTSQGFKTSTGRILQVDKYGIVKEGEKLFQPAWFNYSALIELDGESVTTHPFYGLFYNPFVGDLTVRFKTSTPEEYYRLVNISSDTPGDQLSLDKFSDSSQYIAHLRNVHPGSSFYTIGEDGTYVPLDSQQQLNGNTLVFSRDTVGKGSIITYRDTGSFTLVPNAFTTGVSSLAEVAGGAKGIVDIVAKNIGKSPRNLQRGHLLNKEATP